ncbi:hypothetical protein GIB67_032208 [Kingdonia uniflora]|uniref:DUF4283 domain-containing protein n=1 Tax=Kingdonia uniflora TaxID=39325 RepID=A0A7J7MX88_9MAGN|nr:hypothetical protein GIB67_032208 [Kingdonia uniflora]
MRSLDVISAPSPLEYKVTVYQCLEGGVLAVLQSYVDEDGNSKLITETWKPLIGLETRNHSIVPVWITLRNMPSVLWYPVGISRVACALGLPICLDKVTKEKPRMNYARVCVELNVSKELPNVRQAMVDDTNAEIENAVANDDNVSTEVIEVATHDVEENGTATVTTPNQQQTGDSFGMVTKWQEVCSYKHAMDGCYPKGKAGLGGINDLETWNLAAVMKLTWKIACKHSILSDECPQILNYDSYLSINVCVSNVVSNYKRAVPQHLCHNIPTIVEDLPPTAVIPMRYKILWTASTRGDHAIVETWRT